MDLAAKIRPSGVVAAVILMGWSGLLTIVSIFPPFAPTEIPRWVMGIKIVLGMAMFVVAWGLFSLRSWADIVTMGIQVVNGLFAIITVIAAPRV